MFLEVKFHSKNLFNLKPHFTYKIILNYLRVSCNKSKLSMLFDILFKDDVVKLADFGSCRGVYSKQPYTEYISTRWYVSRGFIKVLNMRATEFDTRAKNWQGPKGLVP